MRACTYPGALILVFAYQFLSFSHSATFTITNSCPFTIWPGTLSGSNSPKLSASGFKLDSGQTAKLFSAPGWSGRIWARTGCTFNESDGGKCQTGDCGGKLECDGIGATPPASLFEITLASTTNQDYYDVSLVDGYNLPLVAVPRGGSGSCYATGCVSNINLGCPKELQVIGSDGGQQGIVACKSACEAFGQDQYCCSGEFANPTTCRPSFYSTIFKRACPRAYSYAFDDGSSTFTCNAPEYAITFCPNANELVFSSTNIVFSLSSFYGYITHCISSCSPENPETPASVPTSTIPTEETPRTGEDASLSTINRVSTLAVLTLSLFTLTI